MKRKEKKRKEKERKRKDIAVKYWNG